MVAFPPGVPDWPTATTIAFGEGTLLAKMALYVHRVEPRLLGSRRNRSGFQRSNRRYRQIGPGQGKMQWRRRTFCSWLIMSPSSLNAKRLLSSTSVLVLTIKKLRNFCSFRFAPRLLHLWVGHDCEDEFQNSVCRWSYDASCVACASH